MGWGLDSGFCCQVISPEVLRAVPVSAAIRSLNRWGKDWETTRIGASNIGGATVDGQNPEPPRMIIIP